MPQFAKISDYTREKSLENVLNFAFFLWAKLKITITDPLAQHLGSSAHNYKFISYCSVASKTIYEKETILVFY